MEKQTSDQLKELVKEKYGKIALQSKDDNASSCCGATTGCSTIDYTVMADDYTQLDGYVADADLGLGCGLPTEFAKIKEGDTVVDLGSGAGNDAFVARSIAGEKGKVIGIDFTDKMVEKAKINAEKLGYTNVEFRQGDIENMPLAGNIADVVVSNCVLNLVPNKQQAFAETFRILKKGGHFSVSDIVLVGDLPEGLQKSAEMYAGCVAGAIQKDDYLSIIQQTGFSAITIQKEKRITLPDKILKDYLSFDQIEEFKTGKTGIFSVTVYAEKPENCCSPGCCD
ncbi:MAG TPA: arsenite methyltransferase [Cyclobacteriaceae bacterium]|nr:arsenite methyltransferase [Cyclobacteriaceae bacterium]HMV08096.1 arsenite methyltransferase [Cyclobacteriaceae bacterium]HMV88311.1 arsenite methyltransferase [Cyclobacteriaceae bacterium]HMX00737.1 arsenite methyltransferase [Cyclobacteriaceae bacterium]HMX49388.1 arsenite methyltransferase [Cyclobacteriaceae bacterium]